MDHRAQSSVKKDTANLALSRSNSARSTLIIAAPMDGAGLLLTVAHGTHVPMTSIYFDQKDWI
jgi:hypothetical protein